MTRHDTIFSLRYAVRVLERLARMWSRIDAIIKMASLISGSSAFAALMSGNQTITLVAGIAFAVLQAVEFALRPSDKAAESRATRKLYAHVIAAQAGLDDDALEQAYHDVVAEDDMIAPEVIRHLAYNDVVHERGCDTAYLYQITGIHRALSLLA